MITDEYFANLKGYEDIYIISNYGTIKSVDRYVKNKNGHRKITGKILKPQIDKYGYLRIGLIKEKRQKFHFVHRLVAETFIQNPNKLPIVNHIDGDKTINTRKVVIQYDLDFHFIKRWKSISEAEKELYIPISEIIRCCKFYNKTAGGYIWRYE